MAVVVLGSYGCQALGYGGRRAAAMAFSTREQDRGRRRRRHYCTADATPAPHLPPRFSVAPMMEWTDNHFRTLARILSRCAWLYTEMVVAETIVHREADLERWLEFPAFQHPIVLQLGGSNVQNLGKAAKLARAFGYDEINLNCGCPSNKVAGHGCFGARLMLTPALVGEAMQAIASESCLPVTVKCRIGVDDADSYDQLCEFVSTVSSLSPTRHFIIHARKALLEGLSPAQNRAVPPLRYEYVIALLRDFPHLHFTLNGGITTVEQVNDFINKGVHGVMVGRAAYNRPWCTLARVDNSVYGRSSEQVTRREVLRQYQDYAESVIGKDGENKPGIRQLVKPLANIFHADQGAGLWRRAIDEHVRHTTSFSELLDKIMVVIPDSVMDAPISYEDPVDEPPICVSILPPPPTNKAHVGHEDDKLFKQLTVLR